MTTRTSSERRRQQAAQEIANELRAIVGQDELAAFIADAGDEAGGYHSLRHHEALVRTRLGGAYDPDAWDAAMEMLA